MDRVDLIWKNGEFVRWEDAQTHVLSHGLHYGTGVFEGIRCYDTESSGPAVFRHADHIDRLFKSAEQVEQATGFVPGAVAPFPLPHVAAVLADRQLLGHDLVWFGAGSPQHMAALAPEDLVRVARAKTVDLVKHA